MIPVVGIPLCPKCGHETAVHRQAETEDGPVCRGAVKLSGKRGERPCKCTRLGGGGDYDHNTRRPHATR